MTDAKQTPERPDLTEGLPDALPDIQVSRAQRWLPSLVWLIPVVAALVGLSMVVKTLLDQGPAITISFASAEGMEAGKTKVKYKDVDIGVIQNITLSPDRRRVLAHVELNKEAAPFAVSDSRFWVVKPRVGAGGVSGLDTLLSGAYIGVDIGKSGEKQHQFTGLDVPPVITTDQPGKPFVLRADDLGSLDIGSPIYYRRILAGQVTGYALDENGKDVVLKVFVNAPYDRYVTSNARFWHASGIDLKLDAGGFQVNTQSLAAIAAGGIAFQAPEDAAAGEVAAAETEFVLAPDQTLAMKRPDGLPVSVMVDFDQSLRGLAPGAPVDFRGVVVGEVRRLGIDFDRQRKRLRMPVELVLYPDRLRGERKSARSEREFLATLVERGLRAQLKTGNLLTGQLYVALDFFPKAPPAVVDVRRDPLQIPAMPGSFEELQSAIAEIVKKAQKIPLDSIGRNLDETLASMNQTLQSLDKVLKRVDGELAPEALATLTEARRTMASAAQALDQDAPLQQDVRETLRELSKSAQSLRMLTDYLERHPEALIKGKQEDRE